MTYILQPSSKEMGSKVVTQEIEDDKEFKLLELEDYDSKVNKPKMTTITHPSQLSNEVCHFSPTTTIFIWEA